MKINSRQNSAFIIIGIGVLFVIILIGQSFLNRDDYMINLIRYRKERNSFIKSSPKSPLPKALRTDFTGLDYYPPNTKYRVVAKLKPAKKMEQIEIMTSNSNAPDRYFIAGKLYFTLDKKKYTLTAFQANPKDARALFVPFRDSTSGITTYGGGRYLPDLRLVNGKVVLDFNRAYNPDCVYDHTSICPVPPPENTLPLYIKAGEKNFDLQSLTSPEKPF